MAYRIEGLARQAFEGLFEMTDTELAARGAMRVTADAPRGYPCRVSLRDADEGEELILLSHVSHDVDGPFRTTYAIYVRKDADAPASFTDEVPDYLDSRTLSPTIESALARAELMLSRTVASFAAGAPSPHPGERPDHSDAPATPSAAVDEPPK